MENNKLHDYMEQHKISLSDLSKLTGIPKATIHNVKKNDLRGAKVGQLLTISRALKLPINYFLDADDLPQVNEAPAEYSNLLRQLVETKDKLNKNLESENDRLKEELSELRAQKKDNKCV